MKKFEGELRNLQVALEQAQTILTSPEVGRRSLKEQLCHRQVRKGTEGGLGNGSAFTVVVLQTQHWIPRELTLKTWAWPIQASGGNSR
jgi:hypothetical protein